MYVCPSATLWLRVKTRSSAATENKKAELSQSWPRDAPYIWASWKFSGVPDNANGYTFPEFLMGFCSD